MPIDDTISFIANQRLLQAHNNFCITEMVPYYNHFIFYPSRSYKL